MFKLSLVGSINLIIIANFLCAIAGAVGIGSSSKNPFDSLNSKRQPQDDLTVDLGYSIYHGVANISTGLHTWKGIRYAAPPTGALRWQAPQVPFASRDSVIEATALPERCPQSGDGPYDPEISYMGSEDCLFLNVYAPSGSLESEEGEGEGEGTLLPVMVWIHGGGYGRGDGSQDLSKLINTNGKGFVGVAIQYRLGAFGFLASDEVFRNGVVNAGLLDQTFALRWVQKYIHLFGGNSSQVTIAGESAGAGSVMLQAMAFGGMLGDSLFSNIIAASPTLRMQYGYADWMPSQSYYAFAYAAGCDISRAYGNTAQTVFKCLVEKDTDTLQNASAFVSASGKYGTWGFVPVTDGVYIQQLPSQQLLKKQVNGVRMLAGNNANEGPSSTVQNITTEDDFVAWLRLTFPLFTNNDIAKILYYYPSTNASVDASLPDYATLGYTGATALNESSFGTGQQQRADPKKNILISQIKRNVYAETTFVCPSYWLAEAFAGDGRAAYKYQYSVPAAQHGADLTGYFGPASPAQGPDFEKAFMTIWGNFIITSNPSIPSAIANGNNSNSSTPNPASTWPQYSIYAPYQLNLNETGGREFSTAVVGGGAPNATEYEEPGLKNDFTLVNAYTWEGGRGIRCDFWRSVGGLVPG
ncbi:MAG: hypothetical protein M1834_003297 [Cirrosporium novae-zelandiae]|nr:MAG: hypothetical protein M1834_003297 [Cirrosporium novae-zelandiae]